VSGIGGNINVSYPNGGELFYSNKSFNVNWSFPHGDNVKIELMRKNGQYHEYYTLVENTENDGYEVVQVPDEIINFGKIFKIKVSSINNSSIYDESNSYFTILNADEPNISITSPNSNSVWGLGETYYIRWETNISDHNFNIELYKGGSFYQDIATVSSNTSSYEWTIPDYLPEATNYKIKITDASNSNDFDESASFTIKLLKTITINSPSCDAQWRIGEQKEIIWTSDNIEDGNNVKIEIDNNGYRRTIASSTPNDGSYMWDIGADFSLTPSNENKIIITLVGDPRAKGESCNFTLLEPYSIQVTSPNGGRIFENATYNITWESNIIGGHYDIYLFRYNTSVQVITQNFYTYDNYYEWTVPTSITSGNGYTIKVVSHDNPDINDYSSSFEIYGPGISGIITRNTTLNSNNYLTGNVFIYPGVVLKISENVNLDLKGYDITVNANNSGDNGMFKAVKATIISSGDYESEIKTDDYTAIISLENSTLDHCNIKTYGRSLFNDVTFKNVNYPIYFYSVYTLPNLENISFGENVTHPGIKISGNITTDLTLKNYGIPYYGGFTIKSNAHVILESGMTFYFDNNNITVGYSSQNQGILSANNVRFVSVNNSLKTMLIYYGSATFNQCTFDKIDIVSDNGSNFTLENNTFKNIEYPIEIGDYPVTSPVISGNVFEESVEHKGIKLTGYIKEDCTIKNYGYPYYPWFYVDDNATITVEDGVVFEFHYRYNNSSHITIGTSSTGTAEDRAGHLAGNNLTFKYEGTGQRSLSIRHPSSTLQIDSSYFKNVMVNLSSSTNNTNSFIHNSSFDFNDQIAINNSSNSVFNAENNYWGDPSGPYNPNSNPSGQGAEVSDNVDFIPWLTVIGAPNVHIEKPQNGDVVYDDLLVLSGTANGMREIDSVLVKLNNNNWELADGFYSWHKYFTIEPGVNKCYAMAKDIDGNGSEIDSVEIYYSPKIQLSSPMNGASSLILPSTLIWEKIATNSVYNIQVALDSSFNNLVINNTISNDTSFTFSNGQLNTRYYWRVKLYSTEYSTTWSDTWMFTTIGFPSVVNAVYPEENATEIPLSVMFKWTKSNDDYQGSRNSVKYKGNVEDNTKIFGPKSITNYWFELTSDTNSTSFIVDSTLADTTKLVTGLNNQRVYWWRIRAKNEVEWGGYSDWFKFSTMGIPISNLHGVVVNENSIKITWDTVRTDIINGYKIFRGRYGEEMEQVAYLTPPDTFYMDDNLEINQLYYYSLKAVDDYNSESDYSDTLYIAPTYLGNNLVLYYSFNNVVTDASGNGIIGNPYNISFTNDRFSRDESALEFDGNSTYIDLGIKPELALDTISIVCWFNTQNSSKEMSIYRWRWEGIQLGVKYGKVFGFIYDQNSQKYTVYSNESEYSDGNWHFAVFTYCDKVLKLYVDNELVGQTQSNGDIKYSMNNSAAAIGRDGNYSGNYFSGVIDEFRIYKSELSTSEIDSLYSTKPYVLYPPSHLFAKPGDSKVTLMWTFSDSWFISGYKIYYSTDTTNGFNLLDVVSSNDTTFIHEGLENGTEYYYKISSVDVIGDESTFSEIVSAMPLKRPENITLLYPQNSELNTPTSLTFIWSKGKELKYVRLIREENYIKKEKFSSINGSNIENSKNISFYWFELTTDTLAAAMIVDSTLSDTTKHVSGLKNLTDYWWRVRAKNEVGWGSYTSWSKFTTIIDTPAVVTLVSPTNESRGLLEPIALIWNSESLAETYSLQVAMNEDFTSMIVDTSGLTDTTFVFDNLNDLTQYYWRVKAVNISGESEWSEVWNFKTLGEPTVVTQLYPEENEVNIPIEFTFSWTKAQDQMKPIIIGGNKLLKGKVGKETINGSKTISNYWFELTSDTSSTAMIIDSTLTDTTKQVSELSNLTDYWWRVRAKNEVGWGSYTVWSKFTTIIDTPSVVTLVLPSNESRGLLMPIELRWNVESLAEAYNLQVATDEGFSSMVVDTSGLADTSFVLNNLNDLTQYYWRVKAVNVGGESVWSEVWNFKTLGKPTVVQLFIPVNNELNVPTSLTFVWSKASDQTKQVSNYWFELTKDINSGNYVVQDTAVVDTLFYVENLDNLTQYYWRVKAKNEIGWGEFSDWFTCTTITPLPDIVNLISPVDSLLYDTTMTETEFAWNQAEYANYYQLELSYNSEFSDIVFSADSLIDTTTTYDETLLNSFYWRVRAVNIAGDGEWNSAFVRLLITGIDEDENGIPTEYVLKQNYPNPFNPTTVIKYSLPKMSKVTLKIYSVLGKEVSTLVNKEQSAGNYRIEFNANNLSSGVYYYRLQAGDFVSVMKMILLK